MPYAKKCGRTKHNTSGRLSSIDSKKRGHLTNQDSQSSGGSDTKMTCRRRIKVGTRVRTLAEYNGSHIEGTVLEVIYPCKGKRFTDGAHEEVADYKPECEPCSKECGRLIFDDFQTTISYFCLGHPDYFGVVDEHGNMHKLRRRGRPKRGSMRVLQRFKGRDCISGRSNSDEETEE